MKTVCSFFVFLLVRQAIGGIVRKPPAFSTPVYSDSYLPAAMQVIFHAVEQLKLLQSEQTSESSSTSASISTSPITHAAQTLPTTPQGTSTVSQITTPASSEGGNKEVGSKDTETSKGTENSTKSSEIDEESTETILVTEVSTGAPIDESLSHQETPEVNEEVPETNYATPEANYETPEDVHEVQETNQEVPEENYEASSSPLDVESSATTMNMEATTESNNPSDSLLDQTTIKHDDVDFEQEKKKPTIESVVQEIYEIVKPTTSEFLNENTEPSDQSKGAVGISVERLDNIEDEDDETRYTRLGEKVTQVPRPSLTSYLRRTKVPPSATLQQLASLYDSLSKDARKQGFGKFSGYSDEIIHVLETSVEGGIGPQLKKLLDKVIKRNELTREDARTKTVLAIRDLDNPSSGLSKDLRPLLPLRYAQ